MADFIVHIHLAWQNLLHADRMRKKAEIFYRELGKQRKFKRNPDGSKKTWDLTQCLKHEFQENDPIRANIEFFIGLRNHIEHRFQDSILTVTAAEAHACIINFESEVIRRFGESETLGNELKFPVFIQSLSPSHYDEQRILRRQLPSSVSTFITEYERSLAEAIRSDERYAYRLLLLPMKGPKTDADMALNFVRQDDLSREDLQALVGREGSVIIAEKYRNAASGDEMLPGAAAAAVESRIPYKFGLNEFTTVRKEWQIGPVKFGSKEQLPKSDGYCLYSPTFNRFTYLPKLVERMVSELDTAEKYKKLVGKLPKPK
nr:DUF3644 domain-containing protein [Nocardia cyriacigeorgica]